MKKICRLSLPYYEENGREGDMKNVLDKGLLATGIKWEDIFAQGERPTHFGNWVLVPVADNEATHKLAEHFGTTLDMFETFIEKTDIDALKIGDRVKIRKWGMFAPFEDEGKVFSISETEVTILKKRSRTKGYRISVNDEAGIWKL